MLASRSKEARAHVVSVNPVRSQSHPPSNSCTMIAANAGSSYISVRMYVMRLVASLHSFPHRRDVIPLMSPHMPR